MKRQGVRRYLIEVFRIRKTVGTWNVAFQMLVDTAHTKQIANIFQRSLYFCILSDEANPWEV